MDILAIKRFRDIARRGKHRGSSSGERTANRLAKAMLAIGDDLACLDSTTIQGACDLLRLMGGPWPTDEAKEAIFDTVRQAAGQRVIG